MSKFGRSPNAWATEALIEIDPKIKVAKIKEIDL